MASRYLEPRLERASRAEMTRLQLRRLREQVAHAARHSPFYRRKLRGVRPIRRSSARSTICGACRSPPRTS